MLPEVPRVCPFLGQGTRQGALFCLRAGVCVARLVQAHQDHSGATALRLKSYPEGCKAETIGELGSLVMSLSKRTNSSENLLTPMCSVTQSLHFRPF